MVLAEPCYSDQNGEQRDTGMRRWSRSLEEGQKGGLDSSGPGLGSLGLAP